MCGGIHYGEVEGLVSVERWSCSRGASCVVEYTMGRLSEAAYECINMFRSVNCQWSFASACALECVCMCVCLCEQLMGFEERLQRSI